METVKALIESMIQFTSEGDADSAIKYRAASRACVISGGCEDYPSGFPRGMQHIDVIEQTIKPFAELLKPDAHDVPVKLTIGANKLLRICNALEALALLGARPEESDDKALSDISEVVYGYDPNVELWALSEALRDALMVARQKADKASEESNTEELESAA